MEQTMLDKIIKTLAAIGGAIAGFFGEWSILMTVLCVCMAVDYVSGVIVGLCNKSLKTESGGLSSKVGFAGLMKKAMILLVVLLATLADKAVGSDSMVFQGAVTCFYIANEGLSVIENAALLGLPVPGIIKKALDALKEKGEEKPKAKDEI